jgi:hypothetical protein
MLILLSYLLNDMSTQSFLGKSEKELVVVSGQGARGRGQGAVSSE